MLQHLAMSAPIAVRLSASVSIRHGLCLCASTFLLCMPLALPAICTSYQLGVKLLAKQGFMQAAAFAAVQGLAGMRMMRAVRCAEFIASVLLACASLPL
jgi:hypothetical protein